MSYSLTKIDNNNYRYNRSSSLEYDKLCKKIKSKYNDLGNSIITSSGMSSINLAFKSIFIDNNWNKINIIYSWELYFDTTSLIEDYYKKIYPNLCIYEVGITSNIESDNEWLIDLFNSEKIKNQINILFIESCSNPNGYCLDMNIIKDLRKLSKKLYVIVDNTWLTSVIFNPFEYDIDIVVTSLSKHYSGGSHIGGALLIKNKYLFDIAKDIYIKSGEHVSTFACSLILNNIDKMADRIKKTSELAYKVAKYLSTLTNIKEVRYPLLEKHPSYKLKDMYFKHGGPDIFLFIIIEKKETLHKKLKNMNIINLKTSYGGQDTRIDDDLTEDNDETWCRISIGYEDNYDIIIEGLKEILLFS
jgi:cystathionine beta-lyase/cystathionine gamma-synthase